MAGVETRRRVARSAMPASIVAVHLRRMRIDQGLIALVFTVVVTTAFVFAAIPQWFNEVVDDGLQHGVRTALPVQRNIQMTRADHIPASSPPNTFARVEEAGEAFEAELAPSIQHIIDWRSWVFDSWRYQVYESPDGPSAPFPRYITLRYQPNIDQYITVVGGRMPAVSDELVVVPQTSFTGPSAAHVYEIAVSTETAEQLNVELGDRLVMEPFRDDPLVRLVPFEQQKPVIVEITGLFTVSDTGDEYWMSNPEIDRADEYDDGNLIHIFATAVMAPEAYRMLADDALHHPFRYTWRYFVNPAAIDADQFDQLAADMRRLEAEYGSSVFIPSETTVITGLSRLFRQYQAQRNLSEIILSVSAIGLFVVALAVIGLLASAAALRRREAVVLIRSRGAATRQIIGGQVVEAFIIVIPAVTLGLLLARLIINGRASGWSLIAAAALVVGTVILFVGAMLPVARRDLGNMEREDVLVQRVPLRRRMLEGLVITLAIAGVYLLRRRGLSGDSAAEELSTSDPYLAAVPVLLGLAVGIVVLRLYPLPVRLLAWVAALRRDLVPVLGFRRAGRMPGVSNLPLLVLLLAVAVGVFSSVILFTIDEGQIQSTWQRVGADYRVDARSSGYLSSRVDLSGVDGVDVIAASYLVSNVSVAGQGTSSATVTLQAVETAEYARVTEGTPADPSFPAALLAAPEGSEIGRPNHPIPAIVSRAGVTASLSRGDTFALRVRGKEITFIVADTRDRFPGLPIDRPFIVTSFDALQAVDPDRRLRATTLFLRAPASAEAELAATLSEQTNAAALQSRQAEYADIHESPLIAGVADGFRLGMLVVALYSGLAIVIALAFSASARARDLGFLRTLGMNQRQVVTLTVVEHVPVVVLALIAGVGLGIAIARLIEPGIDLIAFTGPGLPVTLQIDWLTVAALCAGLVIVVGMAIAGTAYFARRIDLGETLRLGDQ